MYKRILMAVSLLASCVAKGDVSLSKPPFIVVYAQGQQPVENLSVAITNPRKDVAFLITSVEFEGQLPETRYFYHGIYGSIKKKGNNYEHLPMQQVLSRPVGSCFLLPEQSISWQRPMRVLAGGYKVKVTWQEIPMADISKKVWFHSYSKNTTATGVYEPLSEDKEVRYRSITAANNVLPNIVLEGDFPVLSAELDVNCMNKRGGPIQKQKAPEDFTGEGIEYSLGPVSESVVVTDSKVIFRRFNMASRKYELTSSPDISPATVDFIYFCSRSEDKIVPCLLDPNEFGDIIEVQQPYIKMYFYPGITKVPLALFKEILARANERNIPIVLRRIDPNSLGRRLVLVIGVEVDDHGRWQDIDKIKKVPL